MSFELRLMIGAIFTAAVVFLISLYVGYLWPGYFVALVCGVAFLGALTTFARRKLTMVPARIITVISVLLILAHVTSFVRGFDHRDFQMDTLMEIRRTIERGITKNEVRQEMTRILAVYHQQEGKGLTEVVREMIPQKLGEDGVYISNFDLDMDDPRVEDDHVIYAYVLDEESQTFTVTITSEISPGKDEAYQNTGQLMGKHELQFELSEQGVSYEVLN